MKKFLYLLFRLSLIVYIILVAYVMFFNGRGHWSYMSFEDYLLCNSNFVPFSTIFFYIKSMANKTINMDIPILNLSANLLMFLPAGIYLPCFVKRIKSLIRFAAAMFIILIVIELLQFLTRRGSFDIDDLILNMLGAIIGYLIWKIKFVQRFLRGGIKENAEEPHSSEV